MSITTQRDLFLHELGDILFVERILEQEVLPKLINEVKDSELKAGLKRHHTQTRKHVRNVETAFKRMGKAPSAEKCLGFEGLKREHDELTSEATSTLTDAIDTGAAARTEHYEIAAYSGLIAMARGLGEKEIVPLLQENLADEKETLRELEKVSKRLAKGAAPNGRRSMRTRSSAARRTARARTTSSR